MNSDQEKHFWNPKNPETRVSLATYVFENSDEIARIVKDAEVDLANIPPWEDHSFDAYESGNPERVRAQVRAIFEQLQQIRPSAGKFLSYRVEPPDSTSNSQRIRDINEIIQVGHGDCIDWVLFFAACLLNVRIFPLIIITRDHALLGYWVNGTDTQENTLIVIEKDVVIDLINREKIRMLNATRIPPDENGDLKEFEEAEAEAASHKDHIRYAVDVQTARDKGIDSHPVSKLWARRPVENLLRVKGYDVSPGSVIGLLDSDLLIVTPKPFDTTFIIRCDIDQRELGIDKIKRFYEVINKRREQFPNLQGAYISRRGVNQEANDYANLSGIRCLTFEELQRYLMLGARDYLLGLIEDFNNELKEFYIDLAGKHRSGGTSQPIQRIDYHLNEWLKYGSGAIYPILGDQGAGKSTFFRYYAASLARQYLSDPFSNRFPILVDLGKLGISSDIESFMIDHLSSHLGLQHLTYRYFLRMLETGIFVLILDGIDQARPYFDDHSLLTTISKMVNDNNRFILSMKPESFDLFSKDPHAQFFHDPILLAGFDEHQAIEYFRRHFPKATEKDYSGLIKLIYDTPGMTLNPARLNQFIKNLRHEWLHYAANERDITHIETLVNYEKFKNQLHTSLSIHTSLSTTTNIRESVILKMIAEWFYGRNHMILYHVFDVISAVLKRRSR